MATRKPYAQLSKFAQLLGWRTLTMYHHQLHDEDSGFGDRLVTWYESGQSRGERSDLFLIIAECPLEQVATYTGCVYAIRYRIRTRWHGFRLHDHARNRTREIERIAEWLHRKWFFRLKERRRFREVHPECTGFTWNRIREWGLPYEVVDAAKCTTARHNRAAKLLRCNHGKRRRKDKNWWAVQNWRQDKETSRSICLFCSSPPPSLPTVPDGKQALAGRASFDSREAVFSPSGMLLFLGRRAERIVASTHSNVRGVRMSEQPQNNLREQAHEIVDALPDNAIWDDLMEQIYVRQRISAGLRDVEEGRVVSATEVRRRFGFGE